MNWYEFYIWWFNCKQYEPKSFAELLDPKFQEIFYKAYSEGSKVIHTTIFIA